MPDPLVEIPDRAAFKASEVCEIAQIPPYVLRSWEKEFPGLGVVAKPGGPKVYRRSDIEQVLRIKQLLFSEGLTLAGVRRKLEGEPPPVEGPLELPVPEEVKVKVGRIKRELRSLLDLLGPPPTPEAPPAETEAPTWPPAPVPQVAEERTLPLLDAEAETTTQPPAATVPAPHRKRTKR